MNKRTPNPQSATSRLVAREVTKFQTKAKAADQIRALDARLGAGVGAVKERARLQRIVDAG